MPRTSKNKFEIINDEIHISKEGWPLIGLTTYREDYYEELTSKTWTLTKANSETDDKGYLSNKTLGLLHRYIVAKWYGQDVLDTMTQKGFVVDHLNNNHTDCRISNLEFLKKAYNTAKGQAFDVDSKMMEHHIAVNIFKDFSTGCYQITIGCNDDIVGETKDGKKYHITAIMLLYDCDYSIVVNDAENIYDARSRGRVSIHKVAASVSRVIRSFKIAITKRNLEYGKSWYGLAVALELGFTFTICSLDSSFNLCDSLCVGLRDNQADTILRSATVDGLRFPDVGVAPACVRTSDNLHGICHFCIFTHYHIPP